MADSKFDKFQLQDKSYARNVRRLRQACTEHEMELIVPVCPVGYAAEFLAADPNLAEGMPVRKALFVVRDGKLTPRDDLARLVNGSLEQWKRGSPVGWTVDQPGSVSCKDDEVTYDGKPTLRQDHSASKRGVVRVLQTIKVQPWHYYHVSVMAKTENCSSSDFRISAVDMAKGYPLNWQPPPIRKTMDWTRLHATFASLDNSEVTLCLGSYNAKGGKIWWSDVQIEPGGLVNVIRRSSLPLAISSKDGKTIYTEGKDFSEVRDPKLGDDPNPGYFTYWHEPPTVTVPEGSRLQEGQRVLASYHFATLAGKSHQINCCLSEPKIYDLLAEQVKWVKETAQPDFYMMAHDEIRHGGWDDSCARRNMTCGQILAENVRKCCRDHRADGSGKPILAWNDMFDPFHNARKEGWMYLAKGSGPWYGSWEGLPASVLVANWHQNDAASLKFFADRGNRQILAGYYDADPQRITAWLEMAAKVKRVCGVMYTTWVNDYSQLERFLQIALAADDRADAGVPAAATAGVVANVKVRSDKVKDVSSLEAWKKSYIQEGMTDKDKALAIWESVVAHQFQDTPPKEFLHNENDVYDVLKMFNVYGHSYCGVAACEMASLARYVGLKARVSTVVAHVVPEVEWDGRWHMLDASLVNFFVMKDQPPGAVNGRFSRALSNYVVLSGNIASIEEIIAAVKEWYAKNPEYLVRPAGPQDKPRGDGGKLGKLHASEGWLGWKKGPALLADCPFYGWDGWLPAHTHGWYSTMQEYDGSAYFPYEAGYSMGYKVNIQLRPGERLTRNWSNQGLYVNMDGTAGEPGALNGKIGEGSMAYCPKFGDLAPGRIGNGTLEYEVPLDATLEKSAWRLEGLQAAGRLRVEDGVKEGVLEIRNPTSYVYLRGEAALQAVVGPGGSIGVAFSDNNGLNWREVARIDASGPQRIDLSKLILRRYDYRLRLVFQGAGTGLDGLRFRHDIQHSQRPLPALDKGENTIRFSAGPQEGTITIEGSSDVANKGRQLVYADFHPQSRNLKDRLLIDPTKRDGELSYRVETPGDMTRMTIATHYRARDRRGGWDVQVSFDGGQSFKTVSRCAGPAVSFGNFVEVKHIPPGTRSAVVRWLGATGYNATMIFNHRIDADYRLPNAGFRPVKITYRWEEGGAEKTDVHVARKEAESYVVRCTNKPRMKSIALELE